MTQVLKSRLFVDKFSESIQYTFLDYLAGGFELNFMVAIDYTGTPYILKLVVPNFFWIVIDIFINVLFIMITSDGNEIIISMIIVFVI